jgi:hypothetical protein
MYHQLHCLGFLRLVRERPSSIRFETQEEKEHAIYCLSYLRQMVLCHADSTLEPAFGATLVL